MKKFSPAKDIFIFSLPIIMGQIGQTMFGLVDIAVGGRYSTAVVSALGISTSIFVPFLIFGLGISMQVGPMTAQRLKSKKLDNDFYYSSLYIALGLGIILTGLFLLFLFFAADYLGVDSQVLPLIKQYSLIISPTLICSMLYQNNKEYLQAHELTFIPNACIIFFNIVNLFLNITLMFGYFGLPELGIIGTGISTLVCRSLMMVVLHIYTINKFQFQLFKTSKKYIKEIFSQSLPVAIGITAEVFMFAITTIFAGKLGILTSAAHNICLNIASTTFMVPLAFGSAISVKVGHNFGIKNFSLVRQYIKSSLFIITSYSLVTCIAYYLIPTTILSWATNDLDVINIGIGILLFVALFQVPDALQIVLQGALRGISITKSTMYITLFSSLLCVPISYYLGLKTSLGAKGLWLALAIVLTIQTLLYARLLKKNLSQLK